MVKIRLCAVILSLLLLILVGPGMAQAPENIIVSGSAIVNGLIEDLAAASGSQGLDITTSGTTSGIELFCSGELELATASRKMTAEERRVCIDNEVVYSELLIGHHIVAFVAHPDVPTQCLLFETLQDVLKPTASNVVADWSFYRLEDAELPLPVLLPDDMAIEYVIVDGLLAGDGLRLDGQHYGDASEAVGKVSDTAGALALVPWNEDLETIDSILILEVGGEDFGPCALPSIENVENGSYQFATSLYIYVNRAGLESNDNLAELMQFIVDEANSPVIEAAGATPPSGVTYALNIKILADADSDPRLSGDIGDFQFPPDLRGEINIVGAANAHQMLVRAGDSLGEQLIVDFAFAGAPAGINSLCKGEADIVALDGMTEANSLQECATNGIVTMPINLGSQATVLVGNAANEYAACLTTDQVNSIWRADSADVIKSWADVDDKLPDQTLTLFGHSSLDSFTDILLQTAGEIIPPIRRDTEKDFDPLYRAAAVGNVSGGLTYMNWSDYRQVLENDQANIQLVAIDGGSGCVEPSRGSIEDGTYPLARRASLLVNEVSLAGIGTQAFLWSLFDEGNWTALQRDGFVGASILELPIIRRDLLRWYADAEDRYPQVEESSESSDEGEPTDEVVEDSAG